MPGTQPKSVFQLVGAGQVGRGSLYGMQAPLAGRRRLSDLAIRHTPRRVLRALRDGGPQSAEQLRRRLRGRTPQPAIVLAALATLHAAGLATEDPPGRWIACKPPSRDDLLGQLRLRGPHDTRHTFATWLEDAGIPARVIDEVMGHAARWTTPETEARVVAAIEQRLAVSFTIVNQVTTSARIEAVHGNKQD